MAAVKQRKILRSEDPHATGDGDLIPAFRSAFARAAKALFDLPLAVIGATAAPVAEVDAATLCADGPLCFVFMAGDDLRLAALLCADAVSALVRHQTVGRITGPAKGVEARRLTGTDAALCAPLLTEALSRVLVLAPEAAGKAGLESDLACSWLPTAHDLQLALGASRFRRMTLRIDLGGGAVAGSIDLFLIQKQVLETVSRADPDTPHVPASIFFEVRAELDAVLCKMSLSLTALSGLAVGDVVPLSGASVERTSLVGLDGQEIACAVLGQLNGARAVRVLGEDGQAARIGDKAAAPAQFEKATAPASLPKPAEAAAPVEAQAEVDFDTLSIEDAAAEITSLAGLTEEDLAEINAAATADVVGQPV